MSQSVRAVERALDILSCFSGNTPELSLTQISNQIGINKSTVHRLLATLEAKNFLERDPVSGTYHPGIRLIQVSSLALEQNSLRHVAAPFLRQLCDENKENVNLAVLDDTHVIYIDIIEGSQRVKLAATLGQRLPAFCTASGKAILAFMPTTAVVEILKRSMSEYTRHTIVTQESFFENIRQARERGFATSEQEFEDGINAVAAPILDRADQPIASLSVAGPSFRLTGERMAEIGPVVSATAQNIARQFDLNGRP